MRKRSPFLFHITKEVEEIKVFGADCLKKKSRL
jgi:hypothetical protein